MAKESSLLRDVLSNMLMHNQLFLPVVDSNGDFAGTISYQNIQKSILEIYSDETEEE